MHGNGKKPQGARSSYRVSIVLFSFPCRPSRSSPALACGMGHCPGEATPDHSSTAEASFS